MAMRSEIERAQPVAPPEPQTMAATGGPALQPVPASRMGGLFQKALGRGIGNGKALVGAEALLNKASQPRLGLYDRAKQEAEKRQMNATPRPMQPMTPMQPVPATPTNPTGGIVPPTGPGGSSPFPQTNPNDPLTGRTIQRTPAQDRFAIAQQRFDDFVRSSEPQYQAALRQANRLGAAQGRLGSGSLRSDFGNLARDRGTLMRTMGNEFLRNALEGKIEDQFRDIGIAQQQQGFQNQQQQQAFENELRRLGFSEDMINSAFGRALQQYQAGQMGGTGSGMQFQVGQNQMNQGQSALDALNALIRGRPIPGGGSPQTPPIAGGAVTRWPWQSPLPEGAA